MVFFSKTDQQLNYTAGGNKARRYFKESNNRFQILKRQAFELLKTLGWNRIEQPSEIPQPPQPPHPQWIVGDAKLWEICKVPYRLREVNKKAYEPNVISIGPYHYGKPHLKTMEVFKRSCFSKLVEETKLDFNEFREALKPLEREVGNCYEKAFNLGPDKFVEMMVYDGCFVVQLIRNIFPQEVQKLGRHMQVDILYDLLLLENQLPFFLLFELYRLIVPNGGNLDEFVHSALSLFQTSVSGTRTGDGNKKEIKHLLDLVHSCCSPSPQGIERHRVFKEKKLKSQRSCKFIPSATELEEHGISFHGEVEDDDQFTHIAREQEEHGISFHYEEETGIVGLFDIDFTENTKELKIPTLQVDDDTERFFRNFMAYEQFLTNKEPTYFSDYVVFMDNLINTGKDVNLLCKSGIIDNWLGDDEAVAQMFNKLRDFINSPEDFYYAEIFGKVNEHCRRKWNKWKAALKKNYFNTPWSIFSFLAAVVLLLLSLLQTIFSVLSYYS